MAEKILQETRTRKQPTANPAIPMREADATPATPPEEGTSSEVPGSSNLIRENGHLLLKSLESDDWPQVLQDERESRLASLFDVEKP